MIATRIENDYVYMNFGASGDDGDGGLIYETFY